MNFVKLELKDKCLDLFKIKLELYDFCPKVTSNEFSMLIQLELYDICTTVTAHEFSMLIIGNKSWCVHLLNAFIDDPTFLRKKAKTECTCQSILQTVLTSDVPVNVMGMYACL